MISLRLHAVRSRQPRDRRSLPVRALESATVLALTILFLVVGCGPAPPTLEPIPHPDLGAIGTTAREQIEAARSSLERLGPEVANEERAAALGKLGRLYEAYDFDAAARTAYANATTLAPESFRWFYHLGALELEGGDLEPGRRHLETALELRPNDTPTLLRLARAAVDRADFDTASDLYERAARNSPQCAAARFGIGLVALESDRPADAIAALERALELDPSASQVHRPLAMAHRALGDLAAARDHLARAGTTSPICPDPLIAEMRQLASGASALYERAAQARLEGRGELALKLARQAVEADPDLAAARRLLGGLLIDRRESTTALAELEQAAALEPEDRRTYVLIGRAHRMAGDFAASVSALERAVELDPLSVRSHTELARTQIEAGNWSAARARLETALELDPNDVDSAVHHARTLAATGETAEARQRLEAIVARRPDSALARVALGTLAAESGELETAEDQLARALDSDGSADTFALAHFHLARLRAESDQHDLARRHLDTALDLAPGFLEARLARAELARAAGRFAAAERGFASVLEQRPELVAAHTGRALALLQSGRHLEARRLLETAWQEMPEALPVGHLLARILATAPAPRVRSERRAVELAAQLFEQEPNLSHGETVAMALAATGRFDEAIVWQQRLLDETRAGGAPMETLTRLESRLTDYQRGLAPRAAWGD